MNKSTQHLLLFGGTGSIGESIAKNFISTFGRVTIVTRQNVKKQDFSTGLDYVCWDPLLGTSPNSLIFKDEKYSAVCWAQGININDNIYNFDVTKHQDMYSINVLYVMASLNYLLKNGLLRPYSKLLVISSIWQEIARQNKLSYGVTKSALKGLVLSLANDLSKDGFLVNAILPGALDTKMTHSSLTNVQLENIKKGTGFGRLPSLLDVSNMACHLLSNQNTGVTGQFIKIDLGFSDVRII
jgi:3-oxoacyl-[acyl-carrier protein] reductase